MVHDTMWRKLLNALPHGYNMAEEDWQRRHRLMLWVLGVHVPALVALGLVLGYSPRTLVYVAITPVAAVMLGYMLRRHRRTASVTVTAGLVYCSAALVGLTHGTIEAHFHFFIIIGFIALYQDWAPFLFNIVFTVISHGIGSAWQQTLIFDHAAGQSNPWLWSVIHGVAVLLACAGVIVFWRFTEESQREKDMLARRLADSEINRRQFTSDLLTNLARRNQSLLHRQLEIINQMEESERDPDALSDLFALDHIATRVRRNAESLLVLSGEQPPRTWSEPVPLRDVLRAAIAETENLERVVFVVDEQSAVVGHTVTDLTHLLAELTENAVRFSPPDATVTVRSRPDRARPGGRLITIEDWGVGMPAEQIEEANHLLASPPDIDLSVSQRLGFHVVARLAARHGIKVALGVTPGSGTTALVTLPPSLFSPLHSSAATVTTTATVASTGLVTAGVAAASASPPRAVADKRAATQAKAPVEHRPAPDAAARAANPVDWSGWWDPAVASAMPAFNPAPANGVSPAANGVRLGHQRIRLGHQRIRLGHQRVRPDRQRPRLDPQRLRACCQRPRPGLPRKRLQPECRRARGRGRRARARRREHRPGTRCVRPCRQRLRAGHARHRPERFRRRRWSHRRRLRPGGQRLRPDPVRHRPDRRCEQPDHARRRPGRQHGWPGWQWLRRQPARRRYRRGRRRRAQHPRLPCFQFTDLGERPAPGKLQALADPPPADRRRPAGPDRRRPEPAHLRSGRPGQRAAPPHPPSAFVGRAPHPGGGARGAGGRPPVDGGRRRGAVPLPGQQGGRAGGGRRQQARRHHI